MEQADRIKISREIITIPDKNAQAEALKQQALVQIAAAEAIDLANKNLITPYDAPVNGYQLELSRLDGNTRIVVDEQKIQDSGNRKQGNIFFPVLEAGHTPLPVWGQAWTAMFPCLMGGALGKNNDQTYTPMPVTGNEKDLIAAFEAASVIFEGYLGVERCSGKTWDDLVPPGELIDFTELQDKMTEIIGIVNNYKTLIESEINDFYLTDTDLTRQNETILAKDNAIIFKGLLETWLAYIDYSTLVPEPTDESEFLAFDISTLPDSKGKPIVFDALKLAISDRKTFTTSRIGQLTSYLGDVIQDLGSGAITTQSGLYGSRGLFYVLRLHILTGSLFKVKALEMGINAQESTKAANNAGGDAYMTLMVASKFKAPSMGVKIIHVLSSVGFSVGDDVWVVGDNQTELSGKIVGIGGSRIDLDFAVPQKYTPANFSRIYKMK